MVSVRERLAVMEKSMTESEARIAKVLLTQNEPFFLSIGELARRSGVSEATVVRFYRRLGFSSYQELKVALAQEATPVAPSAAYEDVLVDDSPAQVLAKVIAQTVEALNATGSLLDKEALDRAALWLSEAQRIYFIGAGASGAVAMDAAHKFLRLGVQSVACTDSHLQAIIATHLHADDVVVVISHSGESVEVIDAMRLAKARTEKVIGLTGYHNSTLAQEAPVALVVAARETHYRSDAMVSRLVQLAVLDALYVVTVCRRGAGAVEALNRSRLAVARRKR